MGSRDDCTWILDDRNVRRAFQDVLRAAELPKMRIHDLRHTCATLLLAQGIHAKGIRGDLLNEIATQRLGVSQNPAGVKGARHRTGNLMNRRLASSYDGIDVAGVSRRRRRPARHVPR
ncbi:MAG: hypothetical protein DMF84_26810 [Acidobacteria bacterium]|nr:MAG: hypothetical protein DMF84_26810 [Acidobacteriota bacterium]